MDPNFMKFLEEEEDETMHSGADVEAFTAELNRDIEGNASASQLPFGSDIGLPQGDHQTTSQFPSQCQTSGHYGIANFQTGNYLMDTEGKEQHSSQLEPESTRAGNPFSHEPNALPHNPSSDACQKPQDGHNTFPVSLPMNVHASGEPPLKIQVPDPKPNLGREPQVPESQDIRNHPSMEMGSNDQQPMSLDFKNHQSLSIGQGNQQTKSTGINTEQNVLTENQHTGMGMSSQQPMTSGMSSQQPMISGMSSQLPMTNSNQQPDAALRLNKQVPFGKLLPILEPQLDKDRYMQLYTLYSKLKKNEISKDGFIRHMKSIVGDQRLKMAVYKLQTRATTNSQTGSNQFQSQPQISARQHMQSAQAPSNLSNSTSDSNMTKSYEIESQTDSQGVRMTYVETSSAVSFTQDRKHPAFPTQGLNKQQHIHFTQSSFPAHGSAGSSYLPYSATNSASSSALQPQLHDSQMRQASAQQSMVANHLGPTTQAMSMMNMSKSERPNSLGYPQKIQAGIMNTMNRNATRQQSQVQWPIPTNKEEKMGMSSSAPHVKQEPVDQSNEQNRAQMSSPHGLYSLSSAPIKQGDESFQMQSSRAGFATPASLEPPNSISSSISTPMETNNLSSSRMPSPMSTGPGNNSKITPKKPLIGQKKPMDTVSLPPSSKKQKVSAVLLDQSIEHLNDVTAVSGVNLREEEEQLFSSSKDDSRVSEESRRAVQEDEKRLILHKIPLQKKVLEIMAKCGLKSMSNDVEKCLSLCVEERLCGLISNLIRVSKQRVDMEKLRHKTIVTSDVRQQIMAINRKAHEEWMKKQAETEKSQQQNESESSGGVDGDKEKEETRAKSKVNKDEDDKMRTTAANVAVRAATGVGDMMSRWQLMIEANKQKQGGSDTSASGSQPSQDLLQKPSSTAARNVRENQETKKWDSSYGFKNPASVRKVGRNQVVLPQVVRNISVKDVIAILEREPQMSKSTHLYELYNKVSADTAGVGE